MSDRGRQRAVSRRGFVAAVAGIGAAALGIPALLRRADGARRAADDRPAQAAALTEHDLREAGALALVLFPPTPQLSRELIEHTARWWMQGRAARMKPPPPYRAGLAQLARAAAAEQPGRTFAGLSREAAERVVAELMAQPDDTAFRALAADLIEGMYSSPPGWRLVGYATGPGTAAGTHAYVEPPGAP